MNIANVVSSAIKNSFGVTPDRDMVHVHTQCLYPSGTFVRVVVRGGEDTYVVSDEGIGVHEVELAGAEIDNVDALVRHTLKPFGLKSVNGVIRSPACGARSLAYAIASVANASVAVSDWLFTNLKVKPRTQFKDLLESYLKTEFPLNVHPGRLVGGSNKEHTFDTIIFVPTGKKIIVDPVIHDMKSINARVVANIDVKRANHVDVEQRIVYNDDEDWSAEELNLLTLGAVTIPFSKARQVLPRIAHG